MGKNLNGKSPVNEKNTCEDLNFQIPCELVNRVRQYAESNDTSLTNVVIEALDRFLRHRND